MAIKIYAYKTGSQSAHNLAEAMDVWLLRHTGSRYVPRARDTCINWGKGLDFSPARTLNHPSMVGTVVNKLNFFRKILELNRGNENPISIPEFTTDIRVAREWCGVDCRGAARKVVVRHVLDGHEGRGIEIHSMPEDLPQAPLYVKYIPKDYEYRIHVVGNQVIDAQRKVLSRQVDPDTANWSVRNTANGFVFQRHGIEIPDEAKTQALLAVKACGLDFAAADVVWNRRRGRAYVLELNTAPGIEGTTVQNYATALKNLIDNRQQV